jgi:hypothetical protein
MGVLPDAVAALMGSDLAAASSLNPESPVCRLSEPGKSHPSSGTSDELGLNTMKPCVSAAAPSTLWAAGRGNARSMVEHTGVHAVVATSLTSAKHDHHLRFGSRTAVRTASSRARSAVATRSRSMSH